MRVSTVIPAYNAESFLGTAIESVLGGTVPPHEIIVVDDGSTDATAAVAERYPVRYIRQSQAGPGPARHAGILASSGDGLAFLDADDRWTPDKLALQCPILESDPTLDGVFGHVQQSDRQVPQAGIHAGTLLLRRSSYDRVGSFGAFKMGEFLDWYMRANEQGLRFETLPQVVYLRQLHDDNLGRREMGARSEYVRILKAALDRRRQHP